MVTIGVVVVLLVQDVAVVVVNIGVAVEVAAAVATAAAAVTAAAVVEGGMAHPAAVVGGLHPAVAVVVDELAPHRPTPTSWQG